MLRMTIQDWLHRLVLLISFPLLMNRMPRRSMQALRRTPTSVSQSPAATLHRARSGSGMLGERSAFMRIGMAI